MSPNQPVDWDARYRDGATGWERSGLNPAFLSWRDDGALSPCRILVPGGGRSPEPLALAEAGFDVTVVNLAATAVAVQRARLERLHVNATVQQADLLNWEPQQPFDAVYDQTCLCAFPPTLWPQYEARVHDWLGVGGRLFVLFMQTGTAGGPPFHCSLAEMRRLFPRERWEWPSVLETPVAHSAGRSEIPAVLQRR